MLEAITPYAPIINAVTVLASFVFVVWTSHFRKTRRDRIDELKVEMQILLSQGWTNRIVKTHDMNGFMKSLPKKFRKRKYKGLHLCAYNELGYEGKNEVVNYHIGKAESIRHARQFSMQFRQNRRPM